MHRNDLSPIERNFRERNDEFSPLKNSDKAPRGWSLEKDKLV